MPSAHEFRLLDLKPENVMINQTRGPPYVVKIADFGLSEVGDLEDERFDAY